MNGLVLIGGRSRRMGTDKASIAYHGEPEARRCFRLLEPVCEAVFFSARADQSIDGPCIVDHRACGPLGGIVSAFEQEGTRPWLVLACDLPNFFEPARDQLLEARSEAAQVTLFETDRLQPLAAVYEPSAAPVLMRALAGGELSLQRVLRGLRVNAVRPGDPSWLDNANTPEDLENR